MFGSPESATGQVADPILPHVHPALWHEVRLAFDAASLLPLLALPALAALQRLLWTLQGSQGSPADAALALAVGLPLAAGLAVAHLMTIEQEQGFSELRRSYPEPAWRLPLWRCLLGIMLLLLAALLGTLAYTLALGQPLPVVEVVLPALAPAIFLAGLALLISGLSRSYWAAGGLVMAYWFFELQTHGQVSGALFLFYRVWPVPHVSAGENQALLLALGFFWMLLNILMVRSRLGGGRPF